MRTSPYASIAAVLLAVGRDLTSFTDISQVGVDIWLRTVAKGALGMSAARYHPDLLVAMQHLAAAQRHLNYVCQDASEGEEIGHFVNTIIVLGELAEAVYPPQPDWGSDNIIPVDFQSRCRA